MHSSDGPTETRAPEGPGGAEGELRRRLAALLEQEHALSLATVSAAGAPAVAPLFYLPWEGAIFWLSSAQSRHSVNVEREGIAAVAVYAQAPTWRDIHGAQLEGSVEVVRDPTERRRALEAYAARFSLEGALRERMEASTLYRFVPTWARLLDNREGFGFRLEGAL